MGIMQCVRRFFETEGMTPLPWKVISVIFFLQLFVGMKMTMVFSFLPKMVKSFGISEVDTGYYAGMLASTLYIGFLLCSFLWGYIGDTKGKKLSVVLSLVGLAITSLGFGFSYNYYWALVTRLLQGCFFGAAVVCKSIMVEHFDNSNMALGMSIAFSSWTTGFIIGPSMAGVLVFPCEQYPETFHKDSIFAVFPVLLPHLVSVTGLVVVIILTVIYLPNDKKKEVNDRSPLLGNDGGSSNRISDSNKSINHTDTSIINSHLRRTMSCNNIYSGFTREMGLAPPLVNPCKKYNDYRILKLLRNKDCIFCCILYAAMSCAAIANDELFPLFASTSIKYNGMGFSTSEIGIVLLVVSVGIVAIQISLLSKVVTRFGARKAFIWCTLLQCFCFPLTPIAGLLKNRSLLWVVLCSQMFVARIFITGTFLSINILVNNSVEADLVGSANGLGFTLSAIGRLIAPSTFGSIYSWSLTNIKGIKDNTNPLGFPFNQFFSFFVLSVCMSVVSFAAMWLRGHLDLKKVESKVDEELEVERRLTTTI